MVGAPFVFLTVGIVVALVWNARKPIDDLARRKIPVSRFRVARRKSERMRVRCLGLK